MRRFFKKTHLFLLTLLIVFGLNGCSDRPSKEELKALALTAATGRDPVGWEFGRFEITNDYKTQIQNETVLVYEMTLTLKKTDGSSFDTYQGMVKETQPEKYKISLVKQGKEWRYLPGLAFTGPM